MTVLPVPVSFFEFLSCHLQAQPQVRLVVELMTAVKAAAAAGRFRVEPIMPLASMLAVRADWAQAVSTAFSSTLLTAIVESTDDAAVLDELTGRQVAYSVHRHNAGDERYSAANDLLFDSESNRPTRSENHHDGPPGHGAGLGQRLIDVIRVVSDSESECETQAGGAATRGSGSARLSGSSSTGCDSSGTDNGAASCESFSLLSAAAGASRATAASSISFSQASASAAAASTWTSESRRVRRNWAFNAFVDATGADLVILGRPELTREAQITELEQALRREYHDNRDG